MRLVSQQQSVTREKRQNSRKDVEQNSHTRTKHTIVLLIGCSVVVIFWFENDLSSVVAFGKNIKAVGENIKLFSHESSIKGKK